MTREEAVLAMKQGKKVTHDYFTSEEFIFMLEDGYLMNQSGHIMDAEGFWLERLSPIFATGWSIYNEG